jgi:hypothetical protein
MGEDELAPESHLKQLQMELYRYTNDFEFWQNQWEISMAAAFEFITEISKEIRYSRTEFNSLLYLVIISASKFTINYRFHTMKNIALLSLFLLCLHVSKNLNP